jgi:endonuclease G, mitochondrial
MNIDRILADDDLREELLEKLRSLEGCQKIHPEPFDEKSLGSSLESVDAGFGGSPELEAIVRRFGRPVLFIQQNVIAQPDSDLWRDKIEAARANLERVIPSIGRIEARNHPSLPWLGTGWVVAPEVLLTNRHVAVELGRKAGDGFVFKRNPIGRKMGASIDFREEHEQPDEIEFKIPEILHIEEDDGEAPDLAFLRVEAVGEDDQALPPPVPLAPVDPEPEQTVGVIGYAAWDGRRNDEGVMERIFQNVYNVKRLHPGEVMEVTDRFFNHDCSTLGGNSGSPVIDFDTGEAVGIHFAGSFEIQNFAVKASTIRQRMADLGIG